MFQIQNVILQVILNQNEYKSDSHGVYHYVKIKKKMLESCLIYNTC
jgi:hypothetical protein